MKFKFDLQRFSFGGGGTTTVQEREPNEYELTYQKNMADFSTVAAPMMLDVLRKGNQLLNDTYPAIKGYQDIFDDLAIEAYGRQKNALNALEKIPESNNQSLQYTNGLLEDLSDKYGDVATKMAGKQQGVADFIGGEYDSVKGGMSELYNQLDDATGNVNDNLLDYKGSNQSAVGITEAGTNQQLRADARNLNSYGDKL